MKCKTIQTLLADYSARRLAPSDAAEIRSHLDGCTACDLFLREEAALARSLERMSVAEPSADLWARVSAGLDAPGARPQPSWWMAWRRSVAALATGVAATAGLVAYTHFNVPATPVSMDSPDKGVFQIPAALPVKHVNRSLDDPMADQMDNMFAVVDQATKPGAPH